LAGALLVIPLPLLLGNWRLVAVVAGFAGGPEIPREVPVVVPVPCVAERPQRPSMLSDADLLALDDYGLIVALARDRRIRQGYQVELEAAIAGCL